MAGKKGRSGRPKASTTTKTREVAEKLMSSGDITPLEVLVHHMQDTHSIVLGHQAEVMKLLAKRKRLKKPDTIAKHDREIMRLTQQIMENREIALDCATKAAPYVHPRLASVQHTGDLHVTHDDFVEEADERWEQRQSNDNSAGPEKSRANQKPVRGPAPKKEVRGGGGEEKPAAAAVPMVRRK